MLFFFTSAFLALTELVAALLPILCSCKKKPQYVVMEFEDYGGVLLELDPNNAPITVENFVSLVSRGFYDGLTITRIQEGFVVQGGQSEEEIAPIKGEFSENGVDNEITHKKGVISMARTSDPDSATSQFFICLDSKTCSRSLDGKYAGFGQIIVGLKKIERMVGDYAQYGDSDYMGFIWDEEHQPVILRARVVTAKEARDIQKHPEKLNP